jgi:hypothetical protein
MRSLRSIGADHLIDVVAVIAVGVAVIIPNDRELKLSLGELRWKFPVPNT